MSFLQRSIAFSLVIDCWCFQGFRQEDFFFFYVLTDPDQWLLPVDIQR